MSVAEWVDTYGIHHWRIIWSSYRKLACVEFEPTTTELRWCSNRLSYQAMSSTSTRSQLCTATPISSFVETFNDVCFVYIQKSTECSNQ